MTTTFYKIVARLIMTLSLGMGFMNIGIVYADEHDAHHEREAHRAGNPYRTQHWVFDNRYHHGHYYPRIGYSVTVLPSGNLTLGFGSRRFFFQAGVWYEPTPVGFAVVQPPIGIITPVLPPDYSTIWVAGVPYYYANETYYAAAQGGYTVVNPPAAGTYTEAPPAPPPTSAPAPQPSSGTWYYCASTNSYYPYVATCNEGWKPVPASAPPNH
jgi:hypothetical protein